MSWDEVGKQAKRAGIQIHRDRRHLDPIPPLPKVPGRAAAKRKIRKTFGFTYERRWLHRMNESEAKWKRVTHYSWYATAKQRDDAMRSAGGMRGYYEMRNFQPINRASPRRPNEGQQ